MTRKLKALGVALVAVFALSAMAASGASAVDHHFVSSGEGEIEGAALGSQKFESTTGIEEGFECAELNLEGEAEPTATALTITTKYSECVTLGSESPVEVRENGCQKRYTGETTKGNPTGGEHANYHITCPEGAESEIRVTALNLKCATIPPQTVKHAVRYTNETTEGSGETHVHVIGTAHGVTTKTVGFCGEETHTNASTTGAFTVTRPGGISVVST